MRLNGRVAIVTGGSSGIGKAIAMRFAKEGAIPVILGRRREAVTATVDEIRAAGGDARGFQADVSHREAIRDVAAQVIKDDGRIDILVNNAGVSRYRAFDTMNDEDWDTVLNVDLKGVFFCAQAVAPQMERQQYGKIVNISSALGTGTTPNVGGLTPGATSAYASAKAAVIQLTKTLARELGPSGVNVNCVAPGFFLTPMSGTTRTPEQIQEHIRIRTKAAVLGRVGEVDELAAAVLFLASDEASFITGQTLCVDGGRTDRM